MKNKILVVAPHMDDEVLGCGGVISRHVDTRDDLFVCFVAHRVYNHKFNKARNEVERKHAYKARSTLGYKDAVFLDLQDERLDAGIQDIIILLENYIGKIKPDTIYCPFRGDNNQDHRAVFDALRVVSRPQAAKFIKRVLMYEVPSSTEQSPPLIENAFLPNYYVNITGVFKKKIKAYKCYETEMRDYPHPRSEEALRILAKKRGLEIGFEYAEAFVILRDRWC